MKKNNKIKKLLEPSWATKFFAPKIKKYWPGAKKLLSCKIEPLRIFLDYERLICRYHFTFLNYKKKREKKIIILKAQKFKRGFLWPPRIGGVKREYLALTFLTNRKLNKIIPRPLGFYPQIPAYAYEEMPGFVLKQLLPKNHRLKIKEFLSYIPAAALTIKKVHEIKERPPYATLKTKEKINRQLLDSLNLIKKFYPAGYPKFRKMTQVLEILRKKYQNYLYNERSFSLTHGDFQMDNILVNKNKKIILLDWADSDFFNPLDDIGAFFIQTELHLMYVLPQKYQPLFEKVKKIFTKNYFPDGLGPVQQMQIDYFAAKDVLRIITFLSFTQKNWQPVKYSEMMDNLLELVERKIKNLEKKYL